MKELCEWNNYLPTIECAINSAVNCSTGYTPFFLNYIFDYVAPIDLIKGNEQFHNETIGQLCERLKIVWDLARKKLKQAMETQAKY